MKKLGFIGLGTMGRRMAINLLKKGFPLTVYDIMSEKVEDLVKLGARGASSPREVGEASDIVLLSLPGPSQVEEVVLRDNGVLQGIKRGGIVIDLSTSDPLVERKIYEEAKKKGVKFIDAPVSGGAEAAEKAALTIMVGGDKEAFDESIDVLKVIGRNIFYVGPSGMGQVYKLVNQLLINIHTIATAEALVFAAKAGCDLKLLYEIIKTSTGYSLEFERRALRMIERRFDPIGAISIRIKDMELVLRHASRLKVPLILTSITYQIFEIARANGLEDMDAGAVIKVIEKLANTKVITT